MLLVAAIVGYAIGSINPAAIIARVRGVDYRSVGSGNPGATNIARALGPRAGVIVGVLDVLKGFIPALGFLLLTDVAYAPQMAGIAAVIGHVTSPFLHGHGGKGVATSAGAVLAIEPIWLVPVLVVFGVVLKISGRMGIASVSGAAMLIPAAIVWHPQPGDLAFGVAVSLVILLRHQSNIRGALENRRQRRSRGKPDDSSPEGT